MGGIEETLPRRKSPEISDPDQVTDCGKAVSIISLIYLVSKYVIFTLRVFSPPPPLFYFLFRVPNLKAEDLQ